MSTDTAKLGARLRGARQRRFVGRASELELFRQALEEPEAPWAVLWLHGPGGVGKTALLHVLVETAEGAGVPAWRLDLRGADATPPGFTAALTATLGVDDGDAAMSVLGAPGRRMLLLDTFEVARGLDAWLRERFLPELGTGTAVVVAGRDPPGPGWLEDPGWRELLRVVSLRNLPPDDARALLRSQDVAEPLHDRVLAATHGHPLALWLLVEVLAQHRAEGDAVSPALGDSPDVVRVLIERFVAGVPSASHREAVEVCAHARTTTESLLRASVDGGDPAALFAWLRSLSFVEEGPEGVFPRDPARYETVHRRVRAHVMTRVQGSRGRRQQRAVTDLLHLHGANPSLRRFYDWDSLGRAYPDALRPTDHAAVLGMAERHEGPESAALVAFWLERQPEGFVVARTPDRDTPRGFLAIVALHERRRARRGPGCAGDVGVRARPRRPRGRRAGVRDALHGRRRRLPGAVRVLQRRVDVLRAALPHPQPAVVGLHRRVGRPGADRALHGAHRLRPRAGGGLRGRRPAVRGVRA